MALVLMYFDGTFIKLRYDFYHKSLSNSLVKIWLDDGNITVRLNSTDKEVGKVLFQNENELKVSDALLFDIDEDNEDELVILCWKIGRYGKVRPFWVFSDEKKWSEHIYIYDIRAREDSYYVRPIWMASDIGIDAVSIKNEGSILEVNDVSGNRTFWRWDYFGLENVS